MNLMKSYEKSWQHLRDLKLTKQQQEKILHHITTPTIIEKRPTKKAWQIPVVSLLFITILSILILSFIQRPTDLPLTADTNKTIAKVYVHTNENKETFIAQASCLYVPQQCFTNKQKLAQLQQQIKHAPLVSVTDEYWQTVDNFSKQDVLIVHTDGTQQQWKVLKYGTLLNIQTQQVIKLEKSFDLLVNSYDYQHPYKLILTYVFILLSQLTFWIAKKRMPFIERRFFAATVEHAIANAIMLVLCAGILFAIYLLKHSIHATIIYSLFTLYSIMQIYYRKKAGEPPGYLLASAIIQLCFALTFTCMYITWNVHF